jgi:peptidoglycan/xylan/chitin deacetylase (PgdA/CDA1 family)
MQKIASFSKDAISFIMYMLTSLLRRSGSVVLLYHSVGHIKAEDDPHRINILPESFEEHLKVISGHNAKIDIMFDDGYGNNFTNAFPLLKKYGLTATFFLITDFIDGNIESKSFGGENFKERPLTWDEIKIMDRAGMKFGSHSETHPCLSEVSEDRLRKELMNPKRRIEEMLGHPIDSFAYPFGSEGSFCYDLTKKVLLEAKYNYAYTNILGCNTSQSDKFTYRRIRIYREDGPFKLKMKMKGAYDWVDTLIQKRGQLPFSK